MLLFELVEAQVRRTPERIAITFEDERVSYAELNARANRLARGLVERGAGTDDRVALYLDRSVEMVIAMLAVLKAGAAYLPIDVESPVDRVRDQIERAGCRLVLGDAPASNVTTINVAEAEAAHASQSSDDLPPRAHPESLAYVLYTSGSTGKPKAVMVPHRAIVNHMRWMAETFPLADDDAVLQKTAYGFDASVWEFWAPLMAGARLVMARPSAHRDAAYLVDAIERGRVTVLQVVPTMLRVLLDQPGFERTPLRRVFCGGEALPGELAARFTARLSATLCNLYGPTETAIDATYLVCEPPLDATKTVSVGRPVTGASAYVIDAHGRPAPEGQAGELLIGGEAVGRGYLDDPALTAERFVPDPLGAPGARAYRTGDLAHRCADGTFDFHGRVDHQVKVRGNRIELGEIEVALGGYVRVRRAAVTTHELAHEPVIVGYYTGEPCTPAELRGHLQRMLPGYMIPSAFVHVDKLPELPNGKIDRRALPRPEALAVQRVVPPRNATEAILLRIWEGALRTSPISIDQDFFELGGTSLSGVAVLTQARKQLGAVLPLTAMVTAGTIEKLALLVTEKRPQAAWTPLVPIQPKGTKPPLFCMHAVFGETIGYFGLAQRLGEDQPVYGLEAQGLDRETAPLTDIRAMAERYLVEVRRVQPQGPYRLAGWSFGGIVAFEMAQQLVRAGAEVGLLVNFDQRLPDDRYKSRAVRSQAELADPSFVMDQILFFFTANGRTLTPEQIAALKARPPQEQFIAALELGVREKLLPVGFGLEQLQLFVRIFSAHNGALKAYDAQPYAGRLTLFRCDHPDDPPTLGWDRVCGDVEIVPIIGEHYSLFTRPNVLDALAERMKPLLAPNEVVR